MFLSVFEASQWLLDMRGVFAASYGQFELVWAVLHACSGYHSVSPVRFSSLGTWRHVMLSSYHVSSGVLAYGDVIDYLRFAGSIFPVILFGTGSLHLVVAL